MISRKHKAIFVHIHKTAGSSIEKKLGLFNELSRGVQDHRSIHDYERTADIGRFYYLRNSLHYYKHKNLKFGHKYLKYFFSPELTNDEYKTFYKFCFVRNSWSRIFSWYKAIMRDEILKKMQNIPDNYTLKQFIQEKIDHKTFNQLYFITDEKGNIPMDFIGKFENLNNDFAYVCSELGIKNSSLPKLLISNNEHYSDFYDSISKDLVYKLYKKEIDYFNFSFEKTNL